MSRLSGRNSSDTNVSFVPQKRPCNSSLQKDIQFYKKLKKKHKIRQKTLFKDIYKVEFVNSDNSNLTNDRIKSPDKPPVIIRFKRIQHSKTKSLSKDMNYHNQSNIQIPFYRHIPVIRKQSFSNIENVFSKTASNNYIFTFEQTKLYQNIFITYFPMNIYIPHIKSYSKCIRDKIIELEKCNFMCKRSLKLFIQIMSNMGSQKIGKWFYNTPNKIQDDLSFDSNVLVPFTELSKQTHTDFHAVDEWFI